MSGGGGYGGGSIFPMTQNPNEDPLVAQVKELVNARERARATKDFATSDQIRDQLKSMGVDLNDREKMWRAQTGQQGVILGYRGGAGPSDIEINTLVQEREKAKANRNFQVSDMIRDELKALGVHIIDREGHWRASDGRTGTIPGRGEVAGGVQGPAAAPRGGGGASAELAAQVMQAALQNGWTAEQTQQTLAMLGGAPGGGGGAPAGKARAAVPIGTSSSPEAQEAVNFINQCGDAGRVLADSEIEWLITLREKLRSSKDWAASDMIREAMYSKLGIQLHGRDNVWKCKDGRQGAIPQR